jgi:membrane associated rhomboid family serine protease
MEDRYRTYAHSLVPSTTRVVRWLVIANVAVFVLQRLVFDRYLSGEYLRILGLVPAEFLGRGYLWQLVTYMFLHGSIIHVFFNMLFLWMMGTEIERYWGSREFLKYYLVTGCGAGLVNVLVQPRSSVPTIGASGAIFGIIIAFALAFPDREILLYFFIRIKAKHFALLVGALELVALLLLPNSGIARFAHLGGLLIGYVYLRYERLIYPLKRLALKRKAWRDQEALRREEARQQQSREEIDRLLDKIGRDGIDSLSRDERKFLDRQSGRRA